MKRTRYLAVVIIMGLVGATDLLACGDKVLVGSRGTRYHRPKNARAASVVIYGTPAEMAGLEEMLKRQGHRTLTATSLEQLSALASAQRLDAVLAASEIATKIHQILAGSTSAGAVVLNAGTRQSTLLKTIDKAVEQHDSVSRRPVSER